MTFDGRRLEITSGSYSAALAEVGASLVAAHQDDLLGAQTPGREHRA